MRTETLIKEYEGYLKDYYNIGGKRKHNYIRSARELLRYAGRNRITEKAIKDFYETCISRIQPDTIRRQKSHAIRRFTRYLLKTNVITVGEKKSGKSGLETLKNEFLRSCKRKGTRESTLKGIKSRLKIFYRFLAEYNITSGSEITKILVIEFQNYLSTMESEDGSPAYSVDYRCEILGTVRSYLQTLFKLDYCASDLSVWLENPKKPKKIGKNIFTIKEMRDFLSVIEPETKYEFTIKVLCVLLYGTGIRLGEAINMKIADIDFETNVIVLNDTKAGKKRMVPFGKVVGDYLRIYIDKVRHKKAGRRPFEPAGHGNRIRVQGQDDVRGILRNGFEKIGIEKPETPGCEF